MPLKETFWITVAKELKKRGSKLKISENGPFDATVTSRARRSSELPALKINLNYQPKEGNVKGRFTVALTIEAKHRDQILEYLAGEPIKSLAHILPNLNTQREMTPEEEQAMQSMMISPYGEEDTPEPLGRAWIFVVANVVSPHGQDFMDRISPWIAEWCDNINLLHGQLDKHIKKLME